MVRLDEQSSTGIDSRPDVDATREDTFLTSTVDGGAARRIF
jgi:hypothetical protein